MSRFIDVLEVNLAADRLGRLADEVAAHDRTIRSVLARTGDAVDLDIGRLRVVEDWARTTARDLRRRADAARAAVDHPAVAGRFDDLPATAVLLGHLGADLHGLWRRLPEADRLADVGGPLADWLFPAAGRMDTDELVRRLVEAAAVLTQVGHRPEVAAGFLARLRDRLGGGAVGEGGGRGPDVAATQGAALARLAGIVLTLVRDGALGDEAAIAIGAGLSGVVAGAAGDLDLDAVVASGMTGDRAVLLALSGALPAEVVLRLTTAAFVQDEWGPDEPTGPWLGGQRALAGRLSALMATLGTGDLGALDPDVVALMRTVGAVDLPVLEASLRDQLVSLTVVFRYLLLPTGLAVPVEVGAPPPVLSADEVRAWLAAVSGTVASPLLIAALLSDARRRATVAAASMGEQLAAAKPTQSVELTAAAREWKRQSRGLGAMLGLVMDAATDELVALEQQAEQLDEVLHKVVLMLAATAAGQAAAAIRPGLRVVGEWTAAHVLDEIKNDAAVGVAAAVAAGGAAEHELLQVLRWTLYSAIATVPGVPDAPRGADGLLVRWWAHEEGSAERAAIERWWSDPVVAELYADADGAEAGFTEVAADPAR